MNNSHLALMFIRNGHSQAEIARILGLSRQRIHQIVRNYRSRKYNSKKKMKKLTTGCKICRQEANHLHHIDGNTHNNHIDNLMPLCPRCHYELHSGKIAQKINKKLKTNSFAISLKRRNKSEWSKWYVRCIVCENTNHRYYAKGMCSQCYPIYWKIKSKTEELALT